MQHRKTHDEFSNLEDPAAMRFAMQLSAADAAALERDLASVKQSGRGLNAVTYRLHKAVVCRTTQVKMAEMKRRSGA